MPIFPDSFGNIRNLLRGLSGAGSGLNALALDTAEFFTAGPTSVAVRNTSSNTTITATSDDGTPLTVSQNVISGTFTNSGKPNITLVETTSSGASRTTVIPSQVIFSPIATLKGGRDASLGITSTYWTDVYNQSKSMPSLGSYTHMSIKSGNWSDPSVWDAGTVPGNGSTVMIMGGCTVTYDAQTPLGSYASPDAMLADYRAACATQYTTPSDTASANLLATIETYPIKGLMVMSDSTFTISTTATTFMLVDTILCMGTWIMGTETAPLTYPSTDATRRCRFIFMGLQDPTTTERLGLNTMFRMRMWGDTKTPYTKFSIDPKLGDTQVVLDQIPVNWRVGDEIIVTSTTFAGTVGSDSTYTGPSTAYVPYFVFEGSLSFAQASSTAFKKSYDEVRIITAIAGNTVSFSSSTPLAYNHPSYTGTLVDGSTSTIQARCVNLSRSVQFEGAYVLEKGISGTGRHRGHTMHMFHDDAIRKYIEFRNLGRTRIDCTISAPENQAGQPFAMKPSQSATTYLVDTNNVKGRYPVHDHWTGPFFGRRAIISDGLAIHSDLAFAPTPGWGFTHHHSRSHLNNIVTFNTRASGIASEMGSEIGQWIGCISIYNRGDGFPLGGGYGDRQEIISTQNGHFGSGFDNQSREVLQQGNIAISSNYGFVSYQARTSPVSQHSSEDTSLRYADPIVFGQSGSITFTPLGADELTVYGNQQVQYHDWHDNEVHDCDKGFYVTHRDEQDDTDVAPMLASRFKAISKNPYFIDNYSYNYFFKDAYFVGPGNTSGQAVYLGTKTFNFNFANCRSDGFRYFLNDGGSFNFNGFIVDINGDWQAINAPQNFGISFANPASHPQYGVMGPWTTVSTTSNSAVVRIRDYPVLRTADMPQPYPIAGFVSSLTEPSPGTPKPYIYLDTNNGSLSPYGILSVNLRGVVVDSWGIREWTSYQRFQTNQADGKLVIRSNAAATGNVIVKRNGWYYDSNNVAQCRLWFVDADRGTHQYLLIPVDIPLSSGFDPTFLAQNQLSGPNANKPVLPVNPEALIYNDAPSVQTVPYLAISSSGSYIPGGFKSVQDIEPSSTNTSNTVTLTRLTFGQTIPVSITGGLYSQNGGAYTSAPTTAQLGDTFSIQVAASSTLGQATTATLTLGTLVSTYSATVRNYPATGTMVIDYFDDQTATQYLDNRVNWGLLSGTANNVYVSTNKTLMTPGTAGQTSTYMYTQDLGNMIQYVEWGLGTVFSGATFLLSVTDANNWVGASAAASSQIVIKKCVNGTISAIYTLNNISIGPSSNLRFEYNANTAAYKIFIDSNSYLSGTITSPPPAASRMGLTVTSTATSTSIATYIGFGTLAKNSFGDSFYRANQNLDASANWTQIDGVVPSIVISSYAPKSTLETGRGSYRAPSRGVNRTAISCNIHNYTMGYFAVQLTDSNNWVGFQFVGNTSMQFSTCVAGTIYSIGSANAVDSGSYMTRLEYDPATGIGTLYQNGNQIGQWTVPSAQQPPVSQYGGMVATSLGALGARFIFEAF